MALTIPNEATATYGDQAEPDSVDFDILVAGISRSGVINGCAVSQRGAGANMSVDVAAGMVAVAGIAASVTAVNKTIGAADATNPRFDLITVNASGTVAVTAGTAAANAVFPAIPATSVVLAAVYIPANATSVVTAQIVDKRVLLGQSSLGSTRAVVGATTDLIVPGVSILSTAVGVVVGADLIVYMPCWLNQTITLTSLNVEVTTAVASSNIKLGLYRMLSTLQPGALILDSGNISSATTGKKSYSCSQVLEPGGYLAAVSSGSAVQVRGWQSGGWVGQSLNGSTFGGGANIMRTLLRKSLTFAAYTDPGTAWDTSTDGSPPGAHPMVAFGF